MFGKKLIQALEKEEYTQENRCKACTVLNTMLAAIGGMAVARRSRIGGVITFGISTFLIYVRGYLVPGTPMLTENYLPASVLHWFDHSSGSEYTNSGIGDKKASLPDSKQVRNEAEQHANPSVAHRELDSEGTELAKFSPEKYLLKLDVLETCKRGNDICLTEKFENEWSEAMAAQADAGLDTERVASVFNLNTESEKYTLEESGNAWTFRHREEIVGQWPSETALIADLAANVVLKEWDTFWTGKITQQKGSLLNDLRLFIDECPKHDCDVKFREGTVESCCRSYQVVTTVCTENGERVFEKSVDELT